MHTLNKQIYHFKPQLFHHKGYTETNQSIRVNNHLLNSVDYKLKVLFFVKRCGKIPNTQIYYMCKRCSACTERTLL